MSDNVPSIRIVTDSACDLPQSIADARGSRQSFMVPPCTGATVIAS